MTLNFAIRAACIFGISAVLMSALQTTLGDWRYWSIMALVVVHGLAQWEDGRKDRHV
jgi:hypothetical protein